MMTVVSLGFVFILVRMLRIFGCQTARKGTCCLIIGMRFLKEIDLWITLVFCSFI